LDTATYVVGIANFIRKGLYQSIESIMIIGFTHISYERFIAIRYMFKRSTCIQEPLAIGGVKYREI
jgi:hypothetical protein